MAKKIDYASLYTLRKDGRYVATYRDEKGKHFVYDRDPKALYEKMRKLQEPVEKKPATFKEIAQGWHDAHWDQLRAGTKSSYEAPYNRAVERFGDDVAKDVTVRDIYTHLTVLKAMNRSRSSMRIQRTVYSQIFQWAMIQPEYEKEITHNPAANVKIPDGATTPKRRTAPEDDVVKLIQSRAEDAYFGLFAMFLLCTGFRRGEALAIKWKDIDFKQDTISCSKQITCRSGVSVESPTKTVNGVRVVPLLPPLKRLLKKPKKEQLEHYVFPGEDPAKPMPGATYDRKWMHYCKDMGFVTDSPEKKKSKQNKEYIKHNYKPTLTAHTLRHGYATILFEAGVDEYTAQRLLGHADIQTTMAIYTHLREKKKTESVDKLKTFSQNGL